MGRKWTIENKSFDHRRQQLIVTVKLDTYEGKNQWVSERFGLGQDGVRWQLKYTGPDVQLKKIGQIKSKFLVLVAEAVSVGLKFIKTHEKKIKIAEWNAHGSFDIKITYPDSFIPMKIVPDHPVRGKFCDVKFLVRRETIGFYKVMLPQKSHVFSSPVTDPLKANDPIEIKDASAIGFNAFLDVVYDGTVLKDTDVCFEVLEIAEKYNCDYVKQLVAMTLTMMITGDTVIQIPIYANQLRINWLKSAALDFMSNNRIHQMTDFQSLAANKQLMIEVLEAPKKWGAILMSFDTNQINSNNNNSSSKSLLISEILNYNSFDSAVLSKTFFKNMHKSMISIVGIQ